MTIGRRSAGDSWGSPGLAREGASEMSASERAFDDVVSPLTVQALEVYLTPLWRCCRHALQNDN